MTLRFLNSTLLLFLLLGISALKAQVHLVEDAAFAVHLKQQFPSVFSDTLNTVYFDEDDGKTQVNGSLIYPSKGINSIDELHYFIRIDSINFKDNNIDSVATFFELRSLDYINLADNDLKSLTDIYRARSLKHLVAHDNLITAIPSQFSWLKDSIHKIDLSFNSIEDLDIDFTEFTLLEKVNLIRNYFTFEDLEKLKTVPNASAIFQLFPQRHLLIEGRENYHYVGEYFKKELLFDTSLTDITYRFYRELGDYNYELIQTANKPIFEIQNLSQADSGSYFMTMESADPFYNGDTIRTSLFRIYVEECVSYTNFRLDTLDKTHCPNTEVLPRLDGTTNSDFSFTIYSRDNPEVETTIFNNTSAFLPGGEYSLLPFIEGKCQNLTEISFSVFDNSCSEKNTQWKDMVLTPNGDGVHDVYPIEDSGSVEVFNRNGNKLTTFSIPAEWGGTNSSGGLLKPDYYMLLINGEKKTYITIQY